MLPIYKREIAICWFNSSLNRDFKKLNFDRFLLFSWGRGGGGYVINAKTVFFSSKILPFYSTFFNVKKNSIFD
jgi:hypothetical protein